MPDSSDPKAATDAKSAEKIVAHALLVGDRIDAAGLERGDMIATAPFARRLGPAKFVALYRFGVAVFIGLTPAEEEEFLSQISERIVGKRDRKNDETAVLEIQPGHDDRVPPGGPIQVPDLSAARFLVVADVLAKTVSLARDEGALSGVFDAIEPFAAALARTGHAPLNRRKMLRLTGQAILAQHRISGRVAVEETPEVLWDHPSLERLYTRLEDEYELRERARAVSRKLGVIVETGQALTDIFDVDRATRLEAAVVVLIIAEILIAIAQIVLAHH
ncbi:MAG TPA: RMD1 family protein [Methylovirgula sp.]|nr:RMD1 family protein [Methylovirgula sp.]